MILLCSLLQMQQKEIDWFQAIMYDVHSELPKWNAALFNTQRLMVELQDEILDVGYQIKANCYVHFINMPQDPECKLPFPNHAQIGLFRQVKGTVVRMSQTKLLEIKRDFICLNCQIQLH